MYRQPHILLLSFICACWLVPFPFSTAQSAKLPPEDKRLSLYLQSLQNDELEPLDARNECLTRMYRVKGSESLRQLAAGFFEQPKTNALIILCESLVEAVSQGRLHPETVLEAMQSDDDQTQGRALGRFLRVLYFVHYHGTGPGFSGDEQK